MFQVRINNVPVIFSKFFNQTDREAVINAIPGGTIRVVFIDTAAAAELAPTIENLLTRGIECVVRDHHDEPSPSNPRAQAIADAAARIRELCGANAVISDRTSNPACSSLIIPGEFLGQGAVVVADPDPDGLLGAMKAVGLMYEGLDEDAAVLDGPRSEQIAERLTPLATLLVRGLATLPPFDAARPQVKDEAMAKLFADFVSAATPSAWPERGVGHGCPWCGDGSRLNCCQDSQAASDADTMREAARARLETSVEVYEAGVAEAERLAETVIEFIPGVLFVDVTTSPRFDLGTLATNMENRSGCKITVQRKAQGPIAAKHNGVQYSLAVVPAHKATINLQELFPVGFTSSPEAGVISNTSFLLHVSEKNWNEIVLPALTARFGG